MSKPAKNQKISTQQIVIFAILGLNLAISIFALCAALQAKKITEILPVVQGKQELLMSEKIKCYDENKDSFNCENVKRESQQIRELLLGNYEK